MSMIDRYDVHFKKMFLYDMMEVLPDNMRKTTYSRAITIFFLNRGVLQCGLEWVSRGHKIFFEPFLYCKKSTEILLNVWPIGAGSVKWGRLAGFLRGLHRFFTI